MLTASILLQIVLTSEVLKVLMRDVGDFARRNPTTFLVGAFSAGFLAGRVVKNADIARMREAAMSTSGAGTGNGQAGEGGS